LVSTDKFTGLRWNRPIFLFEKTPSLVNGFKRMLLLQAGKRELIAAEVGQFSDILPEQGRFEMMVGNCFLSKAFNVYKPVMVALAGIALAAHTPGALSAQGIEIHMDYFLG
jgi:hypothetical protein